MHEPPDYTGAGSDFLKIIWRQDNMAFNFIRAAAAGAAIALCGVASVHAAVNLPALKIDKTQTTVSGLSSGGFMAVQLHVAYSATFAKGVGVVAGGPFYCAEGSVVNATGRCMASPTGIPTSTLVNTTNTWAGQGVIDPVANLQNSKVYLFSGTLDSVVKTGVMDALRTYYNSFVPAANVVYKKDIASEHAMVTDDYGNGCSTKGAPYIRDCNFDLGGAMLLQDCKHNVNDVQQQYVRNTGYNRWADSNNIVMLYPQTSLAATNSCWDWWGYDSANYSKKSGPQMAAIKAMVDRVGSGGTPNPPVDLPAPTGVSTSGATASSMAIGWNAVSGAASYNVYRNGNKTNALPVTATNFTDTGLAASTTYSWTVRAADGNGAEGAVSAAASGTTLAASGGGTGTCTTASNYAHTMAGRAYVYGGYTFALGSNQSMGLWNIFVNNTLKQTSPNYYVIGTCP